jgi:AbrB family looped-hinge helix DNA binding protein
MSVQKLSSKNQIVIPKEARQAMGVKGGDELLVVVKNDLTLVVRKPKRYVRKWERGRESFKSYMTRLRPRKLDRGFLIGTSRSPHSLSDPV